MDGAIDNRRLAALEQLGRAALLKLSDEEVEAVVWVVILTARSVEDNRKRRKASPAKPKAGKPAATSRKASRSRARS